MCGRYRRSRCRTPSRARAGGWSTGRLPPARMGPVTFDEPGTFLYQCTVHQGDHRRGAIDGARIVAVRQPSAKAIWGDHGARRVSAR